MTARDSPLQLIMRGQVSTETIAGIDSIKVSIDSQKLILQCHSNLFLQKLILQCDSNLFLQN